MADELYTFELLSLTSTVAKEVLNNAGINDKTLAEFIIALHEQSKTQDAFKKKLKDVGADFSDSFAENLDRLILSMHPKYKRKKAKKAKAVADGKAAPASADDEADKTRRLFPGLALPDQEWKPSNEFGKENGEKDAASKEVDDLMSQLEGVAKKKAARPTASDFIEPEEPPSKRPRRDMDIDTPPGREERGGYGRDSDRGYGRRDDSRDYDRGRRDQRGNGRPVMDEKPVLYKIYDGTVQGIKDFGAFVQLDGVMGRVQGMVHVSMMAPGGGRVNSATDLLTRNQRVKVKVMSVGSRVSLSMKDVDQQTGRDLTPHLRIKSEAELAEEERQALTGTNSMPLGVRGGGGSGIVHDDTPTRSAKRLTSPERWEIKQLIASGAVDASEYPNLDEDFSNPLAKAEVEEELDVEVREDEPAFLAGQTKMSLNLSPVKIVKAPDGSLNRAALAGASLAKERREMRQQEVNDEADAEARDFNTPWLDPMSQGDDKVFAQDARGNIMGQKAGEVPKWREETFNKATTFGRITSLSITEQRQSLPIFKLREKLVQAIRDHQILIVVGDTGSGKTTQMTQYLAEEGFADHGKIGCTQPRRVAAMSVAKRVAEEVGCRLGQEVGYTIRFEDCTSPETRIKYMTDGMLQRECLIDPDMTAYSIHLSEPPGDILLFLTGQEEIDTACQILYERMKALGPQVPELLILPVYSALPSEMQSKIFEPAPPGTRKVVIATNIAETSITIDGIYYVVDPGFVKQNAYDPRLGMDSLVVTPISQAQANQRSGRAGRTGPGKCYRLYTEVAFRNEMLPSPIPDIQRQNLSHTILMLKAMGINDLINFGFMDPPPAQTLLTALEQLYALSALDDEGLLTRLGRKMADFPMEPPLAKMLITSVDLGCSEEILSIVAMLSVQNVFYRPKDKQAQADSKKAKFHQPEGDHLTLLTVYNGWKNSKFSNPWCYENFIQARSMRRAQDVRKQLLGIMDRYKHDIISAGKDYNRVRRAICSGFFRNAAKKDPQEGYKTLVEGTPVYIHPSSALFNRNPEWCIYHELLLTTREYCHTVTAIEPKWLVEVAPQFFRVADANKISKRKKQEKIEPLYNKYEKPDEWRLSKVKRSARSSQTFG
ncbi:DEAH-box ATP-dependent RNA helicase prp22 [Ceratobasidium sp. 370]|nr:DEAH-box ATP-dependent RNA helicase prp22 [Ceratobasidium sp. 370]